MEWLFLFGLIVGESAFWAAIAGLFGLLFAGAFWSVFVPVFLVILVVFMASVGLMLL